MRVLIPILIGLLVVGCGKDVKELTAEEKKALIDNVVGEYERTSGIDAKGRPYGGFTSKKVFLENGICQRYGPAGLEAEEKWTIDNGEIHVVDTGPTPSISVHEINTDKSITSIAVIRYGKRKVYPVEYAERFTYKKIK